MTTAVEDVLSVEAWTRLGAQRNGQAWRIPERDADGQIIGRVLRFDDGRRPKAEPGSKRGLTMEWPLRSYAGTSPAEPILVAEGASDAAVGLELGFVTIGRPSATGGLRQLCPLLRDLHVVVVGDNDDAGRRGAEKIADGLHGVAASVKLIFPPDGFNDLRDWYSATAGCSRDDLLVAIRAVDNFKPKADDKRRNHGSVGLTRQLAEAIQEDDHFATDAGGALYHFDGGVYKPKGELRVKRRVKAILAEWNMSVEWSTHCASEVVAYIAIDAPSLWERPPLDTINLMNGLLDVNTRELRPHDPAFLSPIQLPVTFDPAATCPAWDQFVSETFPEDSQVVAYEIPAHLMAPDTSKQKAVLLMGEGANGKGVYLAALTAFIGQRNIAAVSLHKLESDRFAPARLVGKLANLCSDLPSQHLAGTSVFKGLTGGDVMLAERKFVDSFEFLPFARLIFSANHPPRSADASHAFFRRWLVIPFPCTFEPAEQTPRHELDARLADPAELSGVLNKALDVLPRFRPEGFTESPSMREAWSEFRQATDPLIVWLERSTVQTPDAIVAKDDLRRSYNTYATDKGHPMMTAHAITKAINRLFPDIGEAQRTVHGRVAHCWIGLGLAAPEPAR